MADIHVGDVGTVVRATVKDSGVVQDISSATTMNFIFKKPGGDVITRPAGFYTDGTDGKMQYVTVAGDWDENGHWKVQAYLVLASWSGYSDASAFIVEENLQ